MRAFFVSDTQHGHGHDIKGGPRKMKSKNKTSVLIITLAILLPLLTARESYSWESDLHYGLVKWLAVKAGVTPEYAEIIAAGSESADESAVLSASVVVPLFICLQRSQEASRHVQQHHFPSDGYVPAAKRDREVRPGDPKTNNGGNRWVRQEIAVPGNKNFHKTKLNRFGQSLHPLADSWSHQGEPGRPPLCPDHLIWAHSDKRGGWGSHDADLTYKYVEDAVSTARAIYHFLTEFLAQNGEFSVKAPVPWNQLEDRVRAFAKAKTAPEKQEWFNGNPDVPLKDYSTYPCFLWKTSLEGHDKVCEEELAQIQTVTLPPTNLGEVSVFFDYFLTNWILKGRVDGLIKADMNIESIRKGFVIGIHEYPQERWIRTFLLMWLVRDHGLVNKWGHAIPGKEGFNPLAEIVQERWRGFKSLGDAIQFPGINQRYLISEIPGQNSFAATFQFRHTPRDMITLIASKESGRWRIVGLSWIAL